MPERTIHSFETTSKPTPERPVVTRRHCLRSICWSLACLTLIAGFSRAADSVLHLTSAEFVLDDSTSPPPAAAAWKPQALPDNWNLSRSALGGNGWYRLRFELPRQPDRLSAIYVRKLSMNAAFYVNGAFLGSGGRFEEPVARQWNRPQFFTIPPDLLEQGDNVLYVRLWAYPNSRGGLGAIEIGPAAVLRSAYERRYFIQTILPQLCNIVVAGMGLFAFAVWARRGTDSTHLYFSVFTLLWALRSTHLYVRDIPVPAFYWDIWVQSSFGWCAMLFIILATRYSGLRWPRFERILLVYGTVGPILMYVGGPTRLHAIASNWSFAIVPVAIFFEGFLIREAYIKRTVESVLLAIVWALVIAASVHDGLVHRDQLAFDSYYLVSYVMILLAFVVGLIQTNRFVGAFDEAENLNRELEGRVAEKHAELAKNFRRLQEMERRSAVAEERRRLMSDMHDGIGSQLIATLDLAERRDAPRAEIASELREVLDNLRLTIDSLEPTENDLLTVLGNLRYRLQGQLKHRGLALNWQIRDVPKLPSLTPRNVLHILRILQEAFTNVVKHAHASTITVQTGFTEDHIFIRVADDGCGFTGDRKGRGLANMRGRAQALRADLDIASSRAGTTLILRLPRS